MEDFDFNMDDNIGTSVSKLRGDNKQENDMVHTDTDIDYDKIIESINNSESFIQNVENKNYQKHVNTRNNIDMNRLAKNIENDLDNFNNINFSEPLPANFTKNMIPKSKVIEPLLNDNPVKVSNENKISYRSVTQSILEHEYFILLISILLFMLLNNKVVIEFIYNRVPYVKSPYLNLGLRTLVFGLILYGIRKFNL